MILTPALIITTLRLSFTYRKSGFQDTFFTTLVDDKQSNLIFRRNYT